MQPLLINTEVTGKNGKADFLQYDKDDEITTISQIMYLKVSYLGVLP